MNKGFSWPGFIAGVLVLVASASLSFDVPGTDIPISAQSLAVFLVAYLLGWPAGTGTVFLYLLLGGIGLPVFADGKSGWQTFTGGSGGFLVGFLLSAGWISWWKRYADSHSFVQLLGIFTSATVLLLAIGNGYLAHLYGWEKGLQYGFWPFWPGALIKILLAAILVGICRGISESWPYPWKG